MADEKQDTPLRCGLVMPISDIDGYPRGHWTEVKAIITDAVHSVDGLQFDVDLVSSSEVAGVIQKRIVQRLYSDDIVICDVSAKNANVMFELGMRLAFDRPTVLIKDDQTPYIFDTGPLEHIEYPASLRHSQIRAFTAALAEKVKATYERSRQNADSTSYLKSFGTFEVAKIPTKYVEGQDVVIGELKEMRQEMGLLSRIVADTHNTSQRALSLARHVPATVASSLDAGSVTPLGLLGSLVEASEHSPAKDAKTNEALRVAVAHAKARLKQP
ncbi:RNA helicase [Ralstonia insidiosa]|uniref:RNA helicase n=1 Tax=Ralstonia insidiosa TaxID=190721 RepID=UPI000CEDC7D7|nr:RNA helicase [Ralstonia insidiosa]